MPKNLFGRSSSSYYNGKKIVTSFFVRKLYLRSICIEANIEEDIDLKNRHGNKNLPDPISIREPASKNYVDKLFNGPSIIQNTLHIDLNDRKNTSAIFIQVNQPPQIDSPLTAKLNVDICIDDSSLVRNNHNNDFNNFN